MMAAKKREIGSKPANARGSKPPAEPAPAYRKSTAREYVESIIIAVILALFVRTYAVQAFKIPTGSMENNLLIGDHLLVNKFVFAPTATALERALLPVRDIRRGDVIVFKFPEDPERDFVKRVIGLPGEKLEMREKRIYINDKRLDEPYVHFLEPPPAPSAFTETTSTDLRENYGPVTVPAGQYFMMGDNRDNSQDSRYWGFLPRSFVKGRAMMVYWSYEAGPEAYREEGLAARLKGLVSVALNFFTGTRWSRLFHQIH
jgi:signal peptidase I